MADSIPRVNFNDGEGLDEADLNRLQSLLDAKNMQRASNIGRMGGALAMGHFTGVGAFGPGGGEIGQLDPRVLTTTQLMTPSQLGFVNSGWSISAGGDMTLAYGPQQFMQGSGASTPGTPPDGFVGLLSYIADDDEIGPPLSARPSVNSRYDAIGIRLGHAAPSNPIARDFEDAATRALTTTTPNKDQGSLLQHELIQGVEAASPVFPAQTAGYARFATVLRETAETSLNFDNVRLHTFPMHLRTEVVLGKDAWYASTNFQDNPTRPGSVEKNGAGNSSVNFFSRNMNAGSRLVGIGICVQNMAALDIADIKIQRAQYSASGNITLVDLLNVGGGAPLSTSVGGFLFAGLQEFADGAGNTIPIWGNGRTYGPLFSTDATTPAQALASSGLVITVGDTAWIGGENISYVKFYYLD